MIEKIAGKRKISQKTRREYIFAYSLLAIAIVQFCIFYIGVNFNSILLAFRKAVKLEGGGIGYVFTLDNFKRLFSDFRNPDSSVAIGIVNTLKYWGLNMFIMMPISLFISYFLYKKVLFYKGFRVILFLPSIISGVVFVSMFKIMLEPFGPVYTMLDKMFGYEMPFLLTDERTATPTIMFYCFWTGLAGNMILYQGAMNRLPQEVIEAGELDGISWFRELVQIIIPMIWSTVSITIILQVSGIFTAGGPILLFSSQGQAMGGANTMTLPYFIFLQTWLYGSYEYPAAIGIFFTICSLPLVFGIRFVMSKLDPEVEY